MFQMCTNKNNAVLSESVNKISVADPGRGLRSMVLYK